VVPCGDLAAAYTVSCEHPSTGRWPSRNVGAARASEMTIWNTITARASPLTTSVAELGPAGVTKYSEPS
jgi:hypothetical protein